MLWSPSLQRRVSWLLLCRHGTRPRPECSVKPHCEPWLGISRPAGSWPTPHQGWDPVSDQVSHLSHGCMVQLQLYAVVLLTSYPDALSRVRCTAQARAPDRCHGCRGNPNMNSLIGLGAMTSFVAGLASPMAPGVAFDTSFLEEPVMLLAFVLLGRSLEARARLKASSASLSPTKSLSDAALSCSR